MIYVTPESTGMQLARSQSPAIGNAEPRRQEQKLDQFLN